MSEFAHQVGFRQPLGWDRKGHITACWLPKETALLGIQMEFEYPVAPKQTYCLTLTSLRSSWVPAFPWNVVASLAGARPLTPRVSITPLLRCLEMNSSNRVVSPIECYLHVIIRHKSLSCDCNHIKWMNDGRDYNRWSSACGMSG
jgi:hypothetical protein